MEHPNEKASQMMASLLNEFEINAIMSVQLNLKMHLFGLCCFYGYY